MNGKMKTLLAIGGVLMLTACAESVPEVVANVESADGTDVAIVAPVAVTTIPPAAPAAASGPTDAPNSLNGSWNLAANHCGQPTSTTSLLIQGTNFTYPTQQCTVAKSEAGVGTTDVTLSCDGSNRLLKLALAQGRLRVTEDHTTLTYYACGT